jgi:UDP-N-acetyl-D-glucosamine dehydrogenase
MIDSKRSVAPDGAVFEIPDCDTLVDHWRALERRGEARRSAGQKIVAVQGLGFVGAAVAAVVASARNASGEAPYFVIGTDLATPGGYWKIARINAGEVPISSPDPVLTQLTQDAVLNTRNLEATSAEEAYSLADVIVMDLPLDIADRFAASPQDLDVRLQPFEQAVRSIGRRMRADALVLLETTVPIGTTKKVALPLLQAERAARGIHEPPLLAHAYERVMPGPRYVNSIRSFWRTFAGIDERSAAAAREFLGSFIETEHYPLWELDDTNASELAKVLENSYRSVNIAFIHEWALLAERIGVNLFAVIDSIRVRKGTHDNMRLPGFGVGGYCLTKDPLLAQWSATKLFATGVTLEMTLDALRINQRMPLHTFDLTVELAGGDVRGKRILVCGVSYLPDVPDTRNTPSEVLVDALEQAGAILTTHDPYLAVWPERPAVKVKRDLKECLAGTDGVVMAIPHSAYRDADWSGARFLIDAQNGIGDEECARLHRAGVRLAGVGKGHWRELGYHRAISES